MISQQCKKCEVVKPIEDYQFHRVSGKHYQTCRRCRQLASYEWNKKNKDKHNASQKKWRQKNPDREYAVLHPEKHKEVAKKAAQKWKESNPSYHHEHYLKNKAKYVASRAKRRAAQKQATPCWLTNVHKCQLQEFYELAKAKEMQTGTKYHVDHIVPINGGTVTGLHVPWNLQLLTAKENLSKGWRNMPCR
jgi:hypothetical protein